MISMSSAKNFSPSAKAAARGASRAMKAFSPPRMRSTSAMIRASKPSGAPTRSSRPGAGAMRFRSVDWDKRVPLGAAVGAEGRMGEEAEGSEQVHHFAFELFGGRFAPDDPGV